MFNETLDVETPRMFYRVKFLERFYLRKRLAIGTDLIRRITYVNVENQKRLLQNFKREDWNSIISSEIVSMVFCLMIERFSSNRTADKYNK